MTSTIRDVVIKEKISVPSLGSLPRRRITDRLPALVDAGLGLVHGPAGIGKTTAMAQLAASWDGPVSWLRLDHGDTSEDRILLLLRHALGVEKTPSTGIDSLISAVEAQAGQRLLVVDDLQSIVGSPAEQIMHRLVRYRPPTLTMLLGSRHEASLPPAMMLTEPVVVDLEDLRFRLWEVDELMRDHHDIPLAPADLHLLCQYTDGWAAALRLFSVASRDAAPEHRRRLIVGLRTNTGMVHDYLTSEMLSTLSEAHRDLLVDTAVFEQLTPARCDALLQRADTAEMLREVNARGLFSDGSEAAQAYRCHDLLRTHLMGELGGRIGTEALTRRHRDAARIAEAEASLGEAIRYYARAGDLDAVRRMLHASGSELSATPGRWIEVLPSAIREQDPFVALTSARQTLRHGSLEEARGQYRDALALLAGNDSAARSARLELRLLESWLSTTPTPTTGWIPPIRDQLRAIRSNRPGTPHVDTAHPLSAATERFLAGDLARSTEILREHETLTSGLEAALAGVMASLVGVLERGEDGCSLRTLRRLQHSAKELDAPFLERIVGALARRHHDHARDPLIDECRRAGDHFGAGLVGLVSGVAALHRGNAAPHVLGTAADDFAAGGYSTLEAVAEGYRLVATALAGTPTPRRALPPGAADSALCQGLFGLARRIGERDEESRASMAASGPGGLAALVDALTGVRTGDRSAPEPIAVRVLGPLRIEVSGSEIVAELTPQHLEVLASLAVAGGGWIHADELCIRFWPDKDQERARRSLQVAVSKVRGELEHYGVGTVERDGQRYRLRTWEGVTVDIVHLQGLLSATTDDDLDAAGSAMEEILHHHDALVSDLGAVSWAVDARYQLQLEVSRAALRVCSALHEVGDEQRAGRIAEAAVRIDPASDELWRIAIASAGPARARQLQGRYDAVVAAFDADTGITTDRADLA